MGDDPRGAPMGNAGNLPAPRSGADGQGGETLETALVEVIRELMDRFERQAAELARLRAIPERAESLQLTGELGDIRARIAALEAPRRADGPQRAPARGQTRPQAGADLWLPGQPQGYRAGSPAGPSADSEVAELRSRLARLEGQRRAAPFSGRARFLVEALFIGAVAFAAWVADLDPPTLVAVVAVAWLVAAVVEAVSSWRGRELNSQPQGKGRRGGAEMGEAEQHERDPQEAIDEMREKRGEGDELSEEEQEFLESERVRLDEGEGTGTPVP